MASISIRRYIKWLPDAASEPTSTIVLTSPQRRFVDLRILLADDDDKRRGPTGILSYERLDWGMGGTSESTPADPAAGRKWTHSKWNHWVDSRSDAPDGVVDEGDMMPQPDGTTIEVGNMVNPETGRATDYEELWFDEELRAPSGEKPECVVLQAEVEDEKIRGMMVLLGRYCQCIVRRDEAVVAERWERTRLKGKGWAVTVKIGEGETPCERVLVEREEALKTGDTINVGKEVWTVVEAGVC